MYVIFIHSTPRNTTLINSSSPSANSKSSSPLVKRFLNTKQLFTPQERESLSLSNQLTNQDGKDLRNIMCPPHLELHKQNSNCSSRVHSQFSSPRPKGTVHL